MGHMTQPAASQHLRTMVSQPGQAPIPPGSAHQKLCKQKNFNIYIAPCRPKAQRHSADRAKPSNIKADLPVRTAHTFVHHYNSTHCCNRDGFFNIPLPPDQHQISDVAKWM